MSWLTDTTLSMLPGDSQQRAARQRGEPVFGGPYEQGATATPQPAQHDLWSAQPSSSWSRPGSSSSRTPTTATST